ncbi:MAG: hypothetical protein KA184_05370 [Candidatus Hydrogenedentes bacterium]|nr:hypothetical protein [Candidatus Hydrogenedentota bacterium]
MTRAATSKGDRGSALKALLIVVIGAGVVALAVGLILFREPARETPPPPSAPSAPAPVIEEQPAAEAPRVITAPYGKSEYAAAIEDGLTFAAEHHLYHRRDWQIYCILDFLRRKFGLDDKYEIANTCPPELLEVEDRKTAHLLGRFVDPAHRIEQADLDAAGDPITETMARTMYCDLYPVDAAFVDRTLSIIAQATPPDNQLAGYVKTHFIMSLQWLAENGCAGAFPQILAARDSFADVLCGIVEQEKASTDLAFEAMAFLFYLGFGDRVNEAWVAVLATRQLPSGGWVYDPEQNRDDPGHGHPTVLAVWVLLEHALPDTPHMPWLGRAGDDASSGKTGPGQ